MLFVHAHSINSCGERRYNMAGQMVSQGKALSEAMPILVKNGRTRQLRNDSIAALMSRNSMGAMKPLAMKPIPTPVPMRMPARKGRRRLRVRPYCITAQPVSRAKSVTS